MFNIIEVIVWYILASFPKETVSSNFSRSIFGKSASNVLPKTISKIKYFHLTTNSTEAIHKYFPKRNQIEGQTFSNQIQKKYLQIV